MNAMIRVVAISDLHGQFPAIPPCELLIIAGDIAPDFSGSSNGVRQIDWLNTTFAAWLAKVPAEEVVATPGNYDFGLHRHRTLLHDTLRWHLLVDSGVELFGLNIYGSPWVTGLPGWAFNLAESQVEQRWARIPLGTDILVLHGPPYGIGDGIRCYGADDVNEHVGSPALLNAIDRVRPKLVTHGHIHEAKHETVVMDGQTTIVNVSVLNDEYRLSYKPWVARIDGDVRPEVTSRVEDVTA